MEYFIKKNIKNIKIKDENNVQRALTIDDLEIKIAYKKGEKYEKDCNCDSKFMTNIMPEVGSSIQEAYEGKVKKETPIYLIMDNAGGHGTKECIESYVKLLKDKYNIIIKHQIPQSPETNVLDLGIWNSFQSLIKKTHYGNSTNETSLNDSIEEAWKKYLSADVFKKVFERIHHDESNKYIDDY